MRTPEPRGGLFPYLVIAFTSAAATVALAWPNWGMASFLLVPPIGSCAVLIAALAASVRSSSHRRRAESSQSGLTREAGRL